MELPPKRRVRVCNTSPSIIGNLCNGCDWLEVLTRRHRFHEEERFYCNKAGLFVEPGSMTQARCDEIREVRRYTR